MNVTWIYAKFYWNICHHYEPQVLVFVTTFMLSNINLFVNCNLNVFVLCLLRIEILAHTHTKTISELIWHKYKFINACERFVVLFLVIGKFIDSFISLIGQFIEKGII